jgi:hypothetical protein
MHQNFMGSPRLAETTVRRWKFGLLEGRIHLIGRSAKLVNIVQRPTCNSWEN